MGEKKFTVGQTVFVGPHNRVNAYEAAIVKVGRKWVMLDSRERFDPELMRIDTNIGSGGSVYLSVADYILEGQIQKEWVDLRLDKYWSPPKHITLAEIEQIRAILRVGKDKTE